MSTDRLTAIVDGNKELELQISYMRALKRVFPLMTLDEVQAQITNLPALTLAIKEIRFPLVWSKRSMLVDYRVSAYTANDYTDLSQVPTLSELRQGRVQREVCALRLFQDPSLREIVRQVQSIGLEPGSRRDFQVLTTWVVSMGMMANNNILTVIPAKDVREVDVILLRAGKRVAEHARLTDGEIVIGLKDTLVVGVKDIE